MRAKIALLPILLLTLAVFYVSGLAQAESPRLAEAYVQIWPEFDRPAALVITNLILPEKTRLPATIEFRIPAQAELNAVAVNDPVEGLLYADFVETLEGEWRRLTITATARTVHIEYYDALLREGNSRTVNYRWPGGFQVDKFSLAFQLPPSATQLVMTPSWTRVERDKHDFRIYSIDPISLQAEQVFRFSARYEKPDDLLSVSLLQVEAERPLEQTSGRVRWLDILPWVVGLLGLGLIFLGVLVWLSFARPDLFARTSERSRKRHARRPSLGLKEQSGVVYCHACGRRAEPGDRFCRACGEQLRPAP